MLQDTINLLRKGGHVFFVENMKKSCAACHFVMKCSEVCKYFNLTAFVRNGSSFTFYKTLIIPSREDFSGTG